MVRPGQALSEARWFVHQVEEASFPVQSDKKSSYITPCELLALVVALRLWSSDLRQGRIDLCLTPDSDSLCACFASQRWYSASQNLARVLKELSLLCLQESVSVCPRHLPGNQNVLADGISRRYPEIINLFSPKNQCAVLPHHMFVLPRAEEPPDPGESWQ